MRMESLIAELIYAGRTLRRRPGFTAVAVLTLALGIGANTAVFSVFRSVVLRPLPYPNPDRLVALDETFEGVAGFEDGTPIWASYRSFLAWRDGSRSFDAIAATTSGRSTLELGDGVRQVSSAQVTPDYFSIMGVTPILGRTFTANETRGAAAPVVVLSEGLWQQAFAFDPAIVGSDIRLQGETKTVIGVMPDGYRNRYTGAQQLWTPFDIDEERWLASDARWLRLVARLAEGATTEGATQELVAIQTRLGAEFPETHGAKGAVVRDLHGVVIRNVDQRLTLLLIAVGLVLVIATINVGALMLARTLERADEWRLRTALGAGRTEIVRSSVVESVTLASIGGLVGLAFARLGVEGLTRVEGGTLPAGSSVSIDGAVLMYAALISVLVGLLFSVVPAWKFARRDPSGLRAGGHGLAGRAREALVVTESALAVVVLVALGLALRSYATILDQETGIESNGLVTFQTALPEARYPTPETERTFHASLRSALMELPGVEAASSMEALPIEGGAIWPVWVDGVEPPPPGEEIQIPHRFVSPGAFASLGVELVSGRDFTATEFLDAADVVIVDRLFAELFWPGEDPIGRQIRHFRDGAWLRVIGVVESTAQRGLEGGLQPTTFVPRTERDMHVVVRTFLPLDRVVPGLRTALASVDPGIPIDEVRTGSMLLTNDTAGRRFDWLLLLVFAGVGLSLAVIGTYGSLSALVLRRRSEIGVRRALGATGPSVVGRVLRHTLLLGSTGLALGFALSFALSSVLERLVFGIETTDSVTYAAVALLTLVATLLAGAGPAWRASAISPLEAIRRDGR